MDLRKTLSLRGSWESSGVPPPCHGGRSKPGGWISILELTKPVSVGPSTVACASLHQSGLVPILALVWVELVRSHA